MKKIVSLLCAFALAVSMSAVAFAASTPGQTTPGQTTPGQAGDDSTVQMLTNAIVNNINNKTVAEASAQELTRYFNNNKDVVVNREVVTAMTMYLEKYVSNVEEVSLDNAYVAIRTAGNLDTGSVSVSLSGTTIKLNASYTENIQSATGALVTIAVPAANVGDKDYVWSCEGQTGYVTKTPSGDRVMLSFFAPHFSEYVLSEYVEPVTPPTTGGGSSTTTNDAPIKDTGADMSLSLLALAVGGIAVVGGAAVTSRKLRSK